MAGAWCFYSMPTLKSYLCRIDAEDDVYHKTYLPNDERAGLGCANCTDNILTCGKSACLQRAFRDSYMFYGEACPLNVSSRVEVDAVQKMFEQTALDAINDPECNDAVAKASTVPGLIGDIIVKRAVAVGLDSSSESLKKCKVLHCETMKHMFVTDVDGNPTSVTKAECVGPEASWGLAPAKKIFDGCFDVFGSAPTILSEHAFARVASSKNTCLKPAIESVITSQAATWGKIMGALVAAETSQTFIDSNTCFTVLDTNLDIITLIHTIMKDKVKTGQSAFDESHYCGKFFCYVLMASPAITPCTFVDSTSTPDALKEIHAPLITAVGPQGGPDPYENMDVPTYCNEATSNVLSVNAVRNVLNAFQTAWSNSTEGQAGRRRMMDEDGWSSEFDENVNGQKVAKTNGNSLLQSLAREKLPHLFYEDSLPEKTADDYSLQEKTSNVIPTPQHSAVEEVLLKLLHRKPMTTVVAPFAEVNEYRYDFNAENVILLEDLDVGLRLLPAEKEELHSFVELLWPKRTSHHPYYGSRNYFPTEVGPCGGSASSLGGRTGRDPGFTLQAKRYDIEALQVLGFPDFVISITDFFFGPDGYMRDWIEGDAKSLKYCSSSQDNHHGTAEEVVEDSTTQDVKTDSTIRENTIRENTIRDSSQNENPTTIALERRLTKEKERVSQKIQEDSSIAERRRRKIGETTSEKERRLKERRLQSNDDLPDYEVGEWTDCSCYTMCMPGLSTRKVECFSDACAKPKPEAKEACNCTHCADCQVLLNLLIIAICYFVQAFVALVVFLGFVYFSKKSEDDLVGLNFCQKFLGCLCKKMPMTVRVLTITMFFQLSLLSVQAYWPYGQGISWQADCKFPDMWLTAGFLVGVWVFQLIFGMLAKLVIEVPAYLYTPFVRSNGFIFRFKQLLRALGP